MASMEAWRPLCLALAITACAPPLRNLPQSATVAYIAPDPFAQVLFETDTATVQVRYFPHSPTVSVVAWTSADNRYGLRSRMRRDGSLVHEHRLFVSSYYVPWMRTFHLATVDPLVLERLGASRDIYACRFGACSPFETLGWRIPDDLLRSNRDSIEVRFIGRSGRDMRLVVGRDLIRAYLAMVDSVSVTLKSRN